MTEILVGSLILSISALGLAVSLTHSARSRVKTLAVTNSIAMESEIVSKIQDPTVFQGQEENLRSGNLAALRSTFSIALEGWAPIHIGEQFFTADGNSCSGFEQSSCLIKVKLEIRQTSGGTLPQYAFGYRIETNSKETSMAAIGARNATFTNSDYDLMIPVEVYREGTSCPAGTVVARGFDSDTGQIQCLLEPTDRCLPNSLPIGVALTTQGTGLRFVCAPLSVATCASAYAPSQINPASFLSTPTGTCLFLAKRTETARTVAMPITDTPAAYGVSGRFCPDDYRADVISCTAVVTATANVPSPPVGGAMPSGQWQGVEAGNVLVNPANVGTTLQSQSGTSASCYLNNDPATQPGLAGNKAGWTGYVNMQVQCVVDPIRYPLQKPVGGT